MYLSKNCGQAAYLATPALGFLAGLAKPPTQLQATVCRAQAEEGTDQKTRTQQIMEALDGVTETGGAGGSSTFKGLKGADAGWSAIRSMKTGEDAGPAPTFVKESMAAIGEEIAYDVVVLGGTLGIFTAAALQTRGFRCAVVERGALRGRDQEWNISESELEELLTAAGVITDQDKSAMSDIVGVKFNPLRAGFKNGENDPNGVETFCEDVLNLGVRPTALIEATKQHFIKSGGRVFEQQGVTGLTVHPDGIAVAGDADFSISGRLVLDCMGNGSPAVRQARWGQKPDGMCLVVGSCARGSGFKDNTSGDIIYANTPIIRGQQYFWEAFPAGSGPNDRTTYMFAYMDADESRISLLSMLEDYWELMPKYQGVKLDELEFKRVLFGFFPTYKTNSPLQPQFNRLLQIGDASGVQSPVSFGGLAALARHINRTTGALTEALEEDMLGRESLAAINPYLPALSSTWMFQKSMSVGINEAGRVNDDLIVSLLGGNFKSMAALGTPVLKPFLQDVVQFEPMLKILVGVAVDRPLMLPSIISHVGVGPLLEWSSHFVNMGLYTFFYKFLSGAVNGFIVENTSMDSEVRFRARRLIEAWKFGSGLDYER